jgi:hypothetical protein
MSRNPASFVIANSYPGEAISVPVKTVKADSPQGTQGDTGKIQSKGKNGSLKSVKQFQTGLTGLTGFSLTLSMSKGETDYQSPITDH